MIRASQPKGEISRASYFIGVPGVPVFQWRISGVFAGTPAFASGVPRCSRTSRLTCFYGCRDSSLGEITIVQPLGGDQASTKKQKQHMHFAPARLRHSQSDRISGPLFTVSMRGANRTLAEPNFQLMPWPPHENARAQQNTAGESHVPPYGGLGPICSTRLPSAPDATRRSIAQYQEGSARMTDSS